MDAVRIRFFSFHRKILDVGGAGIWIDDITFFNDPVETVRTAHPRSRFQAEEVVISLKKGVLHGHCCGLR